MFAVFDELAQVGQTYLLGGAVVTFDDWNQRANDGLLVGEAALLKEMLDVRVISSVDSLLNEVVEVVLCGYIHQCTMEMNVVFGIEGIGYPVRLY